MNDQICNSTSTVSGVITFTTTDCTPLNIAPRNIDYYWGFIITLSVFICAWTLGFKFNKRK